MAVILRFWRPPVGRTEPAEPAAVAVWLPSGCGPAQPAVTAASPAPIGRQSHDANNRTHPRLACQHLGTQANPTAGAKAGVPAQTGRVAGLPGRLTITRVKDPIGNSPAPGAHPGAPNRTRARPSNDAQRAPAPGRHL